jgi:hypothetical protein
MTAAWFEIDRHRDHLGDDRYRFRDAWGDWATVGEIIHITFTDTDPPKRCRARVVGHDRFGSAIVTPFTGPLAVVGSEIMPGDIPATVTPLPTRPASGFSTGGEAS